MKNPFLKVPVLLNVVFLIISGMVSLFTLTFGFAHFFEGISQAINGNGPNIPFWESILGGIMVALFCIIGIVTFIIAIATARAIFYRLKNKNH